MAALPKCKAIYNSSLSNFQSLRHLLPSVRDGCSPSSTFSTLSSHNSQLNIETVNPLVKKVEYAVRGPIVLRAAEIENELKQGVSKPFDKVIKANIGDCHAVGQKANTFIRQVVAGCSYPPLLEQNVFPDDVNKRCNDILSTVNGSIGCYSESTGLAIVRKHVAEFIENRDGYPAYPNDVILTNGASSSVKLVLELFISNKESNGDSGVMIPIPQYPLYSATVDEFGMHQVPYYLNEEKDWALDISELQRAVTEGRKWSNPRVLCIINPGNPTGQVYSYENIRDIIQFCKDEDLVLMADEVYQDNVWGKGCEFHSFKKVLHDMNLQDQMQMASFHSCSKGYMGECGLRGGYVEIVGIDDDVRYQLNKLQSAQLGSNVVGQVVLDCVVKTPSPGDASYDVFMQEKTNVLDSLRERAKLVYEHLNQLEGVSCREVAGAMYAFPQLRLPQKAIDAAEALNQAPDFFYCSALLEDTGICVVPGSGFKQREGTHHFRMTILPPMDEIVLFIEKLKEFHEGFMETYKD